MGCGSSSDTGATAGQGGAAAAQIVDTNNDGMIQRNELRKYIEKNANLWAMLGVNLNLPETKCQEIATNVAYQMAKLKLSNNNTKGGGISGNAYSSFRDMPDTVKQREPTVDEFQSFINFISNPKGEQEFFQRTVFATYDKDSNGYLDMNELDSFLDIFYEAGSIFAGDVRLPSKDKLKEQVVETLDKNHDGKLEFQEIRQLISGGAQVLTISAGTS